LRGAFDHSAQLLVGRSQQIYKTFTKIFFFITLRFKTIYKVSSSEKITDILLKGCNLVVAYE
jgi:hypothetical protein